MRRSGASQKWFGRRHGTGGRRKSSYRQYRKSDDLRRHDTGGKIVATGLTCLETSCTSRMVSCGTVWHVREKFGGNDNEQSGAADDSSHLSEPSSGHASLGQFQAALGRYCDFDILQDWHDVDPDDRREHAVSKWQYADAGDGVNALARHEVGAAGRNSGATRRSNSSALR